VEHRDSGLAWRVIFPDIEHEPASSHLRELAASDCSPATIRSYAYALLRWFRFLHERFVRWERADRGDVRAFVEHLRETPNPHRLRRRPDAPPAGSVNPRTGKLSPGGHYAARTINHQLSVLFGFYEHTCAAGLGPLVNPVPAQRGRDGGRVFAHHNPMQDFIVRRRATYRQKPPKWSALEVRGGIDQAAAGASSGTGSWAAMRWRSRSRSARVKHQSNGVAVAL
jgi:hypothetical protein